MNTKPQCPKLTKKQKLCKSFEGILSIPFLQFYRLVPIKIDLQELCRTEGSYHDFNFQSIVQKYEKQLSKLSKILSAQKEMPLLQQKITSLEMWEITKVLIFLQLVTLHTDKLANIEKSISSEIKTFQIIHQILLLTYYSRSGNVGDIYRIYEEQEHFINYMIEHPFHISQFYIIKILAVAAASLTGPDQSKQTLTIIRKALALCKKVMSDKRFAKVFSSSSIIQNAVTSKDSEVKLEGQSEFSHIVLFLQLKELKAAQKSGESTQQCYKLIHSLKSSLADMFNKGFINQNVEAYFSKKITNIAEKLFQQSLIADAGHTDSNSQSNTNAGEPLAMINCVIQEQDAASLNQTINQIATQLNTQGEDPCLQEERAPLVSQRPPLRPPSNTADNSLFIIKKSSSLHQFNKIQNNYSQQQQQQSQLMQSQQQQHQQYPKQGNFVLDQQPINSPQALINIQDQTHKQIGQQLQQKKEDILQQIKQIKQENQAIKKQQSQLQLGKQQQPPIPLSPNLNSSKRKMRPQSGLSKHSKALQNYQSSSQMSGLLSCKVSNLSSYIQFEPYDLSLRQLYNKAFFDQSSEIIQQSFQKQNTLRKPQQHLKLQIQHQQSLILQKDLITPLSSPTSQLCQVNQAYPGTSRGSRSYVYPISQQQQQQQQMQSQNHQFSSFVKRQYQSQPTSPQKINLNQVSLKQGVELLQRPSSINNNNQFEDDSTQTSIQQNTNFMKKPQQQPRHNSNDALNNNSITNSNSINISSMLNDHPNIKKAIEQSQRAQIIRLNMEKAQSEALQLKIQQQRSVPLSQIIVIKKQKSQTNQNKESQKSQSSSSSEEEKGNDGISPSTRKKRQDNINGKSGVSDPFQFLKKCETFAKLPAHFGKEKFQRAAKSIKTTINLQQSLRNRQQAEDVAKETTGIAEIPQNYYYEPGNKQFQLKSQGQIDSNLDFSQTTSHLQSDKRIFIPLQNNLNMEQDDCNDGEASGQLENSAEQEQHLQSNKCKIKISEESQKTPLSQFSVEQSSPKRFIQRKNTTNIFINYFRALTTIEKYLLPIIVRLRERIKLRKQQLFDDEDNRDAIIPNLISPNQQDSESGSSLSSSSSNIKQEIQYQDDTVIKSEEEQEIATRLVMGSPQSSIKGHIKMKRKESFKQEFSNINNENIIKMIPQLYKFYRRSNKLKIDNIPKWSQHVKLEKLINSKQFQRQVVQFKDHDSFQFNTLLYNKVVLLSVKYVAIDWMEIPEIILIINIDTRPVTKFSFTISKNEYTQLCAQNSKVIDKVDKLWVVFYHYFENLFKLDEISIKYLQNNCYPIRKEEDQKKNSSIYQNQNAIDADECNNQNYQENERERSKEQVIKDIIEDKVASQVRCKNNAREDNLSNQETPFKGRIDYYLANERTKNFIQNSNNIIGNQPIQKQFSQMISDHHFIELMSCAVQEFCVYHTQKWRKRTGIYYKYNVQRNSLYQPFLKLKIINKLIVRAFARYFEIEDMIFCTQTLSQKSLKTPEKTIQGNNESSNYSIEINNNYTKQRREGTCSNIGVSMINQLPNILNYEYQVRNWSSMFKLKKSIQKRHARQILIQIQNYADSPQFIASFLKKVDKNFYLFAIKIVIINKQTVLDKISSIVNENGDVNWSQIQFCFTLFNSPMVLRQAKDNYENLMFYPENIINEGFSIGFCSKNSNHLETLQQEIAQFIQTGHFRIRLLLRLIRFFSQHVFLNQNLHLQKQPTKALFRLLMPEQENKKTVTDQKGYQYTQRQPKSERQQIFEQECELIERIFLPQEEGFEHSYTKAFSKKFQETYVRNYAQKRTIYQQNVDPEEVDGFGGITNGGVMGGISSIVGSGVGGGIVNQQSKGGQTKDRRGGGSKIITDKSDSQLPHQISLEEIEDRLGNFKRVLNDQTEEQIVENVEIKLCQFKKQVQFIYCRDYNLPITIFITRSLSQDGKSKLLLSVRDNIFLEYSAKIYLNHCMQRFTMLNLLELKDHLKLDTKINRKLRNTVLRQSIVKAITASGRQWCFSNNARKAGSKNNSQYYNQPLILSSLHSLKAHLFIQSAALDNIYFNKPFFFIRKLKFYLQENQKKDRQNSKIKSNTFITNLPDSYVASYTTNMNNKQYFHITLRFFFAQNNQQVQTENPILVHITIANHTQPNKFFKLVMNYQDLLAIDYKELSIQAITRDNSGLSEQRIQKVLDHLIESITVVPTFLGNTIMLPYYIAQTSDSSRVPQPKKTIFNPNNNSKATLQRNHRLSTIALPRSTDFTTINLNHKLRSLRFAQNMFPKYDFESNSKKGSGQQKSFLQNTIIRYRQIVKIVQKVNGGRDFVVFSISRDQISPEEEWIISSYIQRTTRTLITRLTKAQLTVAKNELSKFIKVKLINVIENHHLLKKYYNNYQDFVTRVTFTDFTNEILDKYFPTKKKIKLSQRHVSSNTQLQSPQRQQQSHGVVKSRAAQINAAAEYSINQLLLKKPFDNPQLVNNSQMNFSNQKLSSTETLCLNNHFSLLKQHILKLKNNQLQMLKESRRSSIYMTLSNIVNYWQKSEYIKRFIDLAKSNDEEFRDHSCKKTYTHKSRFAEIYIWDLIINKLVHFCTDDHFKGIFLGFGSVQRLNLNEQMYINYIKIENQGEFFVEIYIDLIQSMLQQLQQQQNQIQQAQQHYHSNHGHHIHGHGHGHNHQKEKLDPIQRQQKEQQLINALLFQPLDFVSYQQTSLYTLNVQNLVIKNAITQSKIITLREMINLFIAEGYYKCMTSYMNSKLSYSELKLMCQFIGFKIKSANFMEMMQKDEQKKKKNKKTNKKNKNKKKSISEDAELINENDVVEEQKNEEDSDDDDDDDDDRDLEFEQVSKTIMLFKFKKNKVETVHVFKMIINPIKRIYVEVYYNQNKKTFQFFWYQKTVRKGQLFKSLKYFVYRIPCFYALHTKKLFLEMNRRALLLIKSRLLLLTNCEEGKEENSLQAKSHMQRVQQFELTYY